MPTFLAGQRITAAMLNELAPLAGYKTADESVTSSTTLQNDDALFLELAANTTYQVILQLAYNGGTQGSSDLKLAWSAPSGATARFAAFWRDTSGANHQGVTDLTTVSALGTNGTSNDYSLLLTGTIITGSAGGTLQVQWAQNTSSATPTTVRANSSLTATQLS